MTTWKSILVTGATGRQGGAVARALLARGEAVRIMTRSPEKTMEWERSGAEVVQGDFEDYQSLRDAVEGVRGAYIMSTPYEQGPGGEVNQGRAMVYACREADVPHIVYSSVCGADKETGIPHFDSKCDVEDYIRESGLLYTILRPVSFMENFESDRVRTSLEKGVLSMPLSPDTTLQMISVDDIGRFAAEALADPESHGGQEIDLAGDERTLRDAVAEIARAMNRPIRYQKMSYDEAEERLGYDLAIMYRWLNEVGYDVDVGGLRARYGIRLTPFSRFLVKSSLFRHAA